VLIKQQSNETTPKTTNEVVMFKIPITIKKQPRTLLSNDLLTSIEAKKAANHVQKK